MNLADATDIIFRKVPAPCGDCIPTGDLDLHVAGVAQSKMRVLVGRSLDFRPSDALICRYRILQVVLFMLAVEAVVVRR